MRERKLYRNNYSNFKFHPTCFSIDIKVWGRFLKINVIKPETLPESRGIIINIILWLITLHFLKYTDMYRSRSRLYIQIACWKGCIVLNNLPSERTPEFPMNELYTGSVLCRTNGSPNYMIMFSKPCIYKVLVVNFTELVSAFHLVTLMRNS